MKLYLFLSVIVYIEKYIISFKLNEIMYKKYETHI